MENKIYYFLHENNQYGPYSLEELSQYAINPDTMFWYQGLENWQTASNIPQLQSLFAKPKTPPPPPPPSAPPPGAYTSPEAQQNNQQEAIHHENVNEVDYDLQPPELSVLAIFGKTTGGLFSNKPKFGNRLTRFYLVYQFQAMMEQNSKEEEPNSQALGEIAAQEMAEGVQGLVSKGLATENQKGVVRIDYFHAGNNIFYFP